jgi:adenosylhomocysteine nucleosidase
MKIGIMGAMPEEVAILLEQMQNKTSTTLGGREYTEGKLHGADVVLVFSRWGKVASASTATTLINYFNVDRLIFSGVAGSVSKDLNIGDVVVSSKLYQHDMDPTPMLPKFQIPLTDYAFMESDANLIAQALQSGKALAENISVFISEEAREKFNLNNVKVTSGVIASADSFIASSEQAQQILKEMPETLAVEMEGAAVAQVCTDYKIPFVVIRTISDNANTDSHVDFPAFIQSVASLYTKHVMEKLIPSLS